MYMKYIKATPLLVQKLWYKLKFLERQFKGHKVIDLGATCKDFMVHYACRIWSVYILLFKTYDKGSSFNFFFAIPLRRHKNIDYNTLFWPACHTDEQNKSLMYIQNVENQNSYSYFVVFYIRQPF